MKKKHHQTSIYCRSKLLLLGVWNLKLAFVFLLSTIVNLQANVKDENKLSSLNLSKGLNWDNTDSFKLRNNFNWSPSNESIRLNGGDLMNTNPSKTLEYLHYGKNYLYAQFVISGIVIDVSGIPLPGINVVEKGTSNGTSTDFDGKFTLDLSNTNGILVFSGLGYATKEVSINEKSVLNVTLEESSEQLDEVVVTALGIRKSTKAIGYSLTEVNGEEMAEIKTPNPINALQGKIAGVNITQNTTGSAGSSRVIIRGASSLSGNNQPLYILDGIPLGNVNNGSSGRFGGFDGGDGISSINPDNIESISVLKGGAASALYGSRAANGVIILTSKQGKKGKGIGVEVNSSVLFTSVNNDLYDFQTEYGQGNRGNKPVNQAESRDLFNQSWGERLDGSSVIQWDGVERPYSYVGNNVDRFYRTGSNIVNTVSLSKATEDMSYRFTATDFSNQEIMPNSSVGRKSFNFNGSANLGKKFTSTVNAQYNVEDALNRIRISGGAANANTSVSLLPTNVDVRTLDPGSNEDGSERTFSSSVFRQNPYYTATRVRNEDTRNRFIASTTLRYEMADWISISGRAGIDTYTLRRTQVEPFGLPYNPVGSILEENVQYSQLDADIFIEIRKEFSEKFGIETIFGANKNTVKQEQLILSGNTFIIPDLEDLGNTLNQGRSRDFEERELAGLYASAEFSYNRFAFLTLTGRNDWFSTLSFPGKTTPNNDFYYSANGSLVLSDAFEMPAFIDFLKIRGGYSEVAGGAQDPYQLALTYQLFGQGHLGQPYTRVNGVSYFGDGATRSGAILPNFNLVPFEKSEIEVGMDIRLLKGRLSIDLAYYKNNTTNDIVPASLPNSTGFAGSFVNLGEIQNQGVEFLINGTPIKNQNFQWNTSLNVAFNEGTVISTNEGDGNINLEPVGGTIGIVQAVGERFGSLEGVAYDRNENGNIRYNIDSNGTPIPVRGDRRLLGQGVPPWVFGFKNDFNYKNWSLGILIDGKFGGQIFSGTNQAAYQGGLHKATLQGRESGLPISGIDAATGQPFTATIAPENLQDYYNGLNQIAEPFIYDADFIMLRQMSLGYTFPKKYLENVFITDFSMSLIGLNLFFLDKEIDNVNPESSYVSGNAQGIENFGVPFTRSYGLNLNLKF